MKTFQLETGRIGLFSLFSLFMNDPRGNFFRAAASNLQSFKEMLFFGSFLFSENTKGGSLHATRFKASKKT